MQLESRIRRMREFLSFMIAKFDMKCYWCNETIDPNSFNQNLGSDDNDPLTIHHIDEDHDNDVLPNKELIHKRCHQEMHKLSTKLGLPPAVVREAKVHGTTHA